jgi:hypothetical protein
MKIKLFVVAIIVALLLVVIFANKTHAQSGINVSGTNFSDYSGTITAGGTAQLQVPLSPNRRSIFIQNLSSDPLYINFTSTAAIATAGSIELSQYATYAKDQTSSVTPEAIYVIAATTGDKFTIKTN